jgi:hypothetical protein
MTGGPGESPDLQAIAGPSTDPSAIPDARTAKELDSVKRVAAKRTPTDRLEESLYRQIADACQKRDLLWEEKARLHDQLSQVQDRLNQVLPENQRLKEAALNGKVFNWLVTVMFAAAGILVSGAGYHPAYKDQMIWSGYATFACGLLALLAHTIYSSFR